MRVNLNHPQIHIHKLSVGKQEIDVAAKHEGIQLGVIYTDVASAVIHNCDVHVEVS